jgi:hypothetical protein
MRTVVRQVNQKKIDLVLTVEKTLTRRVPEVQIPGPEVGWGAGLVNQRLDLRKPVPLGRPGKTSQVQACAEGAETDLGSPPHHRPNGWAPQSHRSACLGVPDMPHSSIVFNGTTALT